IFLAPGGSNPVAAVQEGNPAPEGVVDALGAPALNASGTLAFQATIDHGAMSDDGIYVRDPVGTITRLARDGDFFVPPNDPDNLQQIAGFGDLVALNDAGDVAFTAGGLFDFTTFSSSELEFGVLVAHAGTVTLVTYPGLSTPPYGRIRGSALGP